MTAGHDDAYDVAADASLDEDLPDMTTAPPSRYAEARADILGGLSRYYFWGLLGWMDVKQRYRRSVLGPFWLTISLGLLVGTLAFVYAGLFHQNIRDFLPYVTASFIFWNLISTLVTESCTGFVLVESVAKQMDIPLSVYIFRLVARNFIILGHNAAIWVVVAVVMLIPPSWTLLMLPIPLVFIAVNGVALGISLGMICARFRDIPQIVVNLIQVAFFLTPIMWRPESFPNRQFIEFNPIYYFLEIARAPLLGTVPGLEVWAVVVLLTLVNCGATFLFFARFRSRLAYWL